MVMNTGNGIVFGARGTAQIPVFDPDDIVAELAQLAVDEPDDGASSPDEDDE